MFGLMLAGLLALADSSHCANLYPTDTPWSYASPIAIRLRGGPYKAELDDPNESTERIVADGRTIFVEYMGGILGNWASDVQFVCKASIDGYEAEIFTWKKGEESSVGAIFVSTPMRRSGFAVEMPHDAMDLDREVSELQSIKFVNDPRQLKLLEIKSIQGQLAGVFENEVGERFVAGDGDPVTRGIGLGRGHVVAIGGNEIRVVERGAMHNVTYVFSLHRPVRRLRNTR